MSQIIFLLGCFFSPFMVINEHDIHVSVTDIEINEGGKVSVTVKVFLDDLMNSVGLTPGKELPEDYVGSDELLKQFIDDNVHVMINGKKLALELDVTTPSMPAVWIDLVGNIPEEIEQISIINTMMVKLFDDQTNMVNLNVGGKQYSELLDTDHTDWTVKSF